MTTHPAITNLLENQRQLDADGCMVVVSRQALEEVLGITYELLQALKSLVGIYEDEFGMIGPEMDAAWAAIMLVEGSK